MVQIFHGFTDEDKAHKPAKQHGWLITDGTVGCMTSAIIVDNKECLPLMVEAFIRQTGIDPDQVVVNEINKPLDIPTVTHPFKPAGNQTLDVKVEHVDE